MRIYLFRHGEAQTDGDDASRSLTKDGTSSVKLVGRAFKKMGFNFDIIFSSPLKRALETARIIAKETKYNDDIFEGDEFKPGFSLENLEEVIGRHPEISSVLIVGHEPDLGKIAAALVGSDEVNPIKKAGLALVKVNWKDAKLSGHLEFIAAKDDIIQGKTPNRKG